MKFLRNSFFLISIFSFLFLLVFWYFSNQKIRGAEQAFKVLQKKSLVSFNGIEFFWNDVTIKTEKLVVFKEHKDVDFIGTTVLRSRDLVCNGTNFLYRRNKGCIFSREPIELVMQNIKTTADSVFFDIRKGQLELIGSVRTVYNEAAL